MTVDGRAGVGRDADDEANARRLTEALRAQAALGARPGAAPARTPTPPPAGARTTPGPGTGGLRPGGPSASQPGHAMAARGRPVGRPAGPRVPDRGGRPDGPAPVGGSGPRPAAPSAAAGPAPSGSTAGGRAAPAARSTSHRSAAGPGAAAVRLRWVLLAALLAGALLGCLLAVLSLLDTGLFPALG